MFAAEVPTFSENKNPAKIDSMFFAATDEEIELLGSEFSNMPKNETKLEFNQLEDCNKTLSETELHKRDYRDFDTFILCNPNAMNYQHMINYPHAFYMKYFLNRQINILVWNYRGYGRTQGSPDPDSIKKDAEQVFHFLKTRVGVRGKIGIYGRSLGCIAACHLHEYVDMVIADRGFSDLWTVANRKFYSELSMYLFKYLSFGWQANNDFNYITQNDNSRPPSYKVLLQDKNDEIVNFPSSLMVGVAS